MKVANEIRNYFLEIARLACASSTDTPRRAGSGGSLVIRGSLTLEGSTADTYFELLEKAANKLKSEPAWSKASIDRLFSERLVSLFTNTHPKNHIEAEAKVLLRQLRVQPSEWARNLSVFGLAPDVNTVDFGEIKIAPHKFTAQSDLYGKYSAGEEVNLHIASVKLKAVDRDSADARALRVIERHISILNALISFGTPSLYFLSTIPLESFALQIYTVKSGTETLIRSRKTWVQISNEELQRRLETSRGKFIGSLLRQSNEFADVLLGSYEIAGEACIEPNRHKMFLLFTIALESAVMCGNSQEITYKLAVRIAHLLGRNSNHRREVFVRIKGLYKVRSSLVHSGNKEISQPDVEEMRIICLTALYQLSKLAEEHQITSQEALERWFDSRILATA